MSDPAESKTGGANLGKRDLSSPREAPKQYKSSGQSRSAQKRPSSGQTILPRSEESKQFSNQAITSPPQPRSSGQHKQKEILESPRASSITRSPYNFEELRGRYRIIEKLDSGTFADVWKGEKMCKEGDEPPKNRYVAIKRLHSISSRRRANEIKILWEFGGKAHIAQLLDLYRHETRLCMVMPYFEIVSFTEYFDRMTVKDVRDYMRALLSSLAVLAEKGWVHRDVKPCNFIHRPANWQNSDSPARYMLIDFGLAQEESELRRKAYMQERRLQLIYSKGKKVKSLISIDEDSCTTAPPANDEDCFWVSNSEKKRTKKSGFLEEALDNNILAAPERSGTRGYRAPEVLCKTWHQGPALDVWSAGVILLSILTRIYPFFEASDDIHALAEIVHIVGKRPLQLAANRVNRCFKVRNNGQSKERWSSFSNFAKSLLSNHKKTSSVAGGGVECRGERCRLISALEVESGHNCSKADAEWPEEVWELLDRLLTIDQLDRITAKDALELPFLGNQRINSTTS